MKQRIVIQKHIRLWLALVILLGFLPALPAAAATAGPPVLTNPEIDPLAHISGDYVGYGDTVISNASGLAIRWEDVHADYYQVSVRVLYGEPKFGEAEDGYDIVAYQEYYTDTCISLTEANMKEAAGKWLKVFISAVYEDSRYNCHYYFQVEAENDSLTLDSTSVNLTWDEASEACVQIWSAESYSFSIAYDVPVGIDSEYNYAWLNVEDTGSALVFTPNRANYAAAARTAFVTVTSGSESKTITVTQDACDEDAPTIELYRGSSVYSHGDDIGSFILPQTAVELDITSANVRSMTADLYSGANEWLSRCTDISRIRLDLSGLPVGEYYIKIDASNSDTDKDYWKQTPFAGESMILHFRLINQLNDETDEIVAAALELLYVHEGSYGSVNRDDNGAVSVGKLQWHANRALFLLRTIVEADPAAAEAILGYNLYNEILTADSWDDRTVTSEEAKVLKALLTTEQGKAAQDTLAAADVGKYINRGRNLGIQHAAVLIYFADMENQGGAGMSTRVAKAASEIAGSYSEITLTMLHNAALEDRIAGKYPNRRNTTYEYCQDFDAALPEIPGNNLEVSQRDVHMTWDIDNEAAIQISGVSSYNFRIAYDIPEGVDPEYNYDWLNVSDMDGSLILKPSRANYAATARTAVVSVISGSERKTITVTQDPCAEATPTITLFHDSIEYTDGSFLGAFQLPAEDITISITSVNVRKVEAYLIDTDGNIRSESLDTRCIAFETSSLPAGYYKIIVYASNSDTEKDYWSQSPFPAGSVTLNLELLAPHAHDYESIIVNPTCTEQGCITHICIFCGHSYADNYVDPLGHSFTNYISNGDAACTEDGSKTAYCDRGCGATDTVADEGSATGHHYEDGRCTDCGAEEGYTAEWKAATTSLNGTIDLNIYVVLSENLLNAEDAFVRFMYAGKTVDVPVSEGIESVSNGVTRYRYSCELYAKEVSETVTIQVMKGNQVIGEPLNYSIVTYCMSRIQNSSNPKQVAICKALLNYATQAQISLNYNLGNLANAQLDEADKVLPESIDVSDYGTRITGSETGIKAKSATLMLEAEVFVRVYFTLEEGYDIEDFTFTIDGKEVEIQKNSTGWFIETEGIPAKDLDKMFKFSVGGLTVEYGALSYVGSKLNSSKPDTVNMARALYAYYTAAEALLG